MDVDVGLTVDRRLAVDGRLAVGAAVRRGEVATGVCHGPVPKFGSGGVVRSCSLSATVEVPGVIAGRDGAAATGAVVYSSSRSGLNPRSLMN